MTAPMTVKMSQGYVVLRPKSDHAFPIPCHEWDVLKQQIETLTMEPWLFQASGSLFIGAALATVISVWTGAISTTMANAVVIAWAVVAVCLICGVACLYFAHKERMVHRAKAQNVLTQMRLIEERFDRDASL